MRLRLLTARPLAGAALVAAGLGMSLPALAHPDGGYGADYAHSDREDPRPEWRGPELGGGPERPQPLGHPANQEISGEAREAWLADCRRNLSRRDNGLGGAAIGGIVGGVAGNRIAGRGNRTVGTIAGAAVGAATGMAIDKSEDNARNRDACETYLDDYYAYYAAYGQAGYGQAPYGQPYGYGRGYGTYVQPAYGYGYPAYGYAAAGGCCQPAAMVPAPQPECTETVEYEYVPVPARRVIPRAPQKRTKIVPDKRIRVK